MGTTSSNIGLYKPANGEQGWGDDINSNTDEIDNRFGGDTAVSKLTATSIAITNAVANLTVTTLAPTTITGASVTLTVTTLTVSTITITGTDIYFS